jgi:hypothetical protein
VPLRSSGDWQNEIPDLSFELIGHTVNLQQKIEILLSKPVHLQIHNFKPSGVRFFGMIRNPKSL